MANTHSLDLEASSSQYASIADGSQTGLDITSSLTIECFVKFESLPAANGYMTLVSKYDQGTSNQSYFLAYRNDIGGGGPIGLFFRKSSNGSNGTAGSVHINWSPTLSTWYHVAAVYDDVAGTAELFIDTASIGSDSVDTLGSGIYNGNADFMIGAVKNSGTPTLFFDGLIDEVRVWNDVRTPTEIADNYDTELVGNESGLVGYWKLNNNYLDETSNNNDLTASGSPVFSTDVPFGGATPITVTPDMFLMDISVQSATILGTADEVTPDAINMELAMQIPTFIAPITIMPTSIAVNLTMQANKSPNWSIFNKSSLGSWSESDKSSLGDWANKNKS